MEEVVLVDHMDNEIGVEEKILAHEKGSLHRALSVFIFNSKGEMLIQQRAASKYHSANLWSNACCSHPRPNEDIKVAASRRLKEELGIAADLDWLMSFQYKVAFENGLTEHELDHVFVGISDEKVVLNPSEASAIRYISPEQLLAEIESEPDNFTFWFKELIQDVLEKSKNRMI